MEKLDELTEIKMIIKLQKAAFGYRAVHHWQHKEITKAAHHMLRAQGYDVDAYLAGGKVEAE